MMKVEDFSSPERKHPGAPRKDCAEKHTLCSASGRITLGYFIDRLAEEIVLSENSCQCDMCVNESCSMQVSGMVCLNGVVLWLLRQAEEYEKDAAQREADYFSYLDSLSETQLPDAVKLIELRFPRFKMSVGGARAIVEEWKARKGCGL